MVGGRCCRDVAAGGENDRWTIVVSLQRSSMRQRSSNDRRWWATCLLVVVWWWWFVGGGLFGGDSRSTDYSLTWLLPSLNNIWSLWSSLNQLHSYPLLTDSQQIILDHTYHYCLLPIFHDCCVFSYKATSLSSSHILDSLYCLWYTLAEASLIMNHFVILPV